MKCDRIAKPAVRLTSPIRRIGLVAFLGCLWASAALAAPPRRPADFKPYRYEYTTEQLEEKFSADQMKRAEAAWKEIQAVNEKDPWKPTWESLDKHEAPAWLLDAKLGIMFNWGLYSVPGYGGGGAPAYPDAYGAWMYRHFLSHHAAFWGADFHYDDFFPLFRAEHYDPDAWVELAQRAGARYVVPFCKHHDGVAWWDSAWTKRNFVQMGPKRDLLTPLMEAARRRGMKAAVYFCYDEYANVVLGQNGQRLFRSWYLDAKHQASVPLDDANRRRVSGNVPVSNYYDHYMMPLVKELIDRFNPDGLWMDGEWITPVETLHSRELAAYFYNKNHGRKDVYVNDRYGEKTRMQHGDIYISEFHAITSLPSHPWTECSGLGRAFAYLYEDSDQSLMPPVKLIHMFVDIISHNGNLDLVVGPDATGRIPQPVVDRLTALGDWIRTNSEAVYATRILPPYHEGNVAYTRSKDGKFAYVICKQWPGRHLTLTGVRAAKDATITMLGVKPPLEWKQIDGELGIDIPQDLQDVSARPCQHAWVLKIPRQP